MGCFTFKVLSLLLVVKIVSGYTECYSKSSSIPNHIFSDHIILDYPLNNNTFKLDIHSSKGRVQLHTISGTVGCHSGGGTTCCVKYFSEITNLTIKVVCLDPECHLHDHSKLSGFPLVVTKIWFICIVFVCVIANICLLWFLLIKKNGTHH